MKCIEEKWHNITFEVRLSSSSAEHSQSPDETLHLIKENWLNFFKTRDPQTYKDYSGRLIIQDLSPLEIEGNLSFWLKRAFIRERAQMSFYDAEADALKGLTVLWVKDLGEEKAPAGMPFDFSQKDILLPITPKGKVRALLLDRDGIINEDGGYVYKKEDVTFVEGIAEVIAKANELGVLVVVLTNQSGVGRAYYSEEDVISLHGWMSEELSKRGARVDDWFYSPFHPESKDPKYKKTSYTRKPMPGMALIAAKKYEISLGESLMVGDKVSDILAQVDIKTLLLKGNYPVANYSHICHNHKEVLEEVIRFFS